MHIRKFLTKEHIECLTTVIFQDVAFEFIGNKNCVLIFISTIPDSFRLPRHPQIIPCQLGGAIDLRNDIGNTNRLLYCDNEFCHKHD